MARRDWDSLSDSYRKRLERNGIGKTAYESGAALQKARGHTSQRNESFTRRTKRFAENFSGSHEPEDIRREILDMGPSKGEAYMDYRRKMTRLYEAGRYREAESLYSQRDVSIPANMWWYHGMFGG